MPRAIPLRKAIDLMHRSGTRLVRMHTGASPDGVAHYLVPGGYVEPEVAEKIKAQPDVIPGEDGLFPGHHQTWRIGR